MIHRLATVGFGFLLISGCSAPIKPTQLDNLDLLRTAKLENGNQLLLRSNGLPIQVFGKTSSSEMRLFLFETARIEFLKPPGLLVFASGMPDAVEFQFLGEKDGRILLCRKQFNKNTTTQDTISIPSYDDEQKP